MGRTKYNKLVRDKILEVIEADNASPVWHTVTGKDLRRAILEKIVEEAKELLESDGDLGERADIAAILKKLDEVQGWTKADVDAASEEKAKKRGEFEKGIYLEEIITND